MSAVPRPTIRPSARRGRELRARLRRHDVEVPVEVDRPRPVADAAADDARLLELAAAGSSISSGERPRRVHRVAQQPPAARRARGPAGSRCRSRRAPRPAPPSRRRGGEPPAGGHRLPRDTGRGWRTRNVDTFLRAADATNRGDADALLAVTHPDAVAEPIRAATEGAYVGHDGFLQVPGGHRGHVRVLPAPTTPTCASWTTAACSRSVRCPCAAAAAAWRPPVPSAVVTEYRDGLLWRFKDYGDEVSARQHL